MDDLLDVEARRDANVANLCRAFVAPPRGGEGAELPAPFADLLARLAAKAGQGAADHARGPQLAVA